MPPKKTSNPKSTSSSSPQSPVSRAKNPLVVVVELSVRSDKKCEIQSFLNQLNSVLSLSYYRDIIKPKLTFAKRQLRARLQSKLIEKNLAKIIADVPDIYEHFFCDPYYGERSYSDNITDFFKSTILPALQKRHCFISSLMIAAHGSHVRLSAMYRRSESERARSDNAAIPLLDVRHWLYTLRDSGYCPASVFMLSCNTARSRLSDMSLLAPLFPSISFFGFDAPVNSTTLAEENSVPLTLIRNAFWSNVIIRSLNNAEQSLLDQTRTIIDRRVNNSSSSSSSSSSRSSSSSSGGGGGGSSSSSSSHEHAYHSVLVYNVGQAAKSEVLSSHYAAQVYEMASAQPVSAILSETKEQLHAYCKYHLYLLESSKNAPCPPIFVFDQVLRVLLNKQAYKKFSCAVNIIHNVFGIDAISHAHTRLREMRQVHDTVERDKTMKSATASDRMAFLLIELYTKCSPKSARFTECIHDLRELISNECSNIDFETCIAILPLLYNEMTVEEWRTAVNEENSSTGQLLQSLESFSSSSSSCSAPKEIRSQIFDHITKFPYYSLPYSNNYYAIVEDNLRKLLSIEPDIEEFQAVLLGQKEESKESRFLITLRNLHAR